MRGVLVVVIPLALLAALLYSYSDFLEQRAASLDALKDHPSVADNRPRLVRALAGAAGTMRRLVVDRRWAAGWLIGTAALGVQAVALHLGSVALVQTLQVTSLLFAIPLSTVYSPLSPGARDYLGAGLICAGLIALITVRGAPENDTRRPAVTLAVRCSSR